MSGTKLIKNRVFEYDKSSHTWKSDAGWKETRLSMNKGVNLVKKNTEKSYLFVNNAITVWKPIQTADVTLRR